MNGTATECLLVQLDSRKSGQVTVDHSRLPVSTVLALFLDGCEVERVCGMFPWLDEAHAAVLHRLAADLRARGEAMDGPIGTAALFLLAKLDRTPAVPKEWLEPLREQIQRARNQMPHARPDDPQRLQRRLDGVRRQVERTALLHEFRELLAEAVSPDGDEALALIDRIDAALQATGGSDA